MTGQPTREVDPRRLRVLAVTPWFPTLGAGGVGIFNLRDVQLIANDHDVTVLHLCPPAQITAPPIEATGVRVERVPFSFMQPSSLPGAVAAIRRRIRGADLLHTMALPALIPAWLARVKVPWVHTEHYSALVTAPPTTRAAVSLGVLKRLFRRPTETVAVSAALARVIDARRRRPSTVIGNEVMSPVEPVRDRPLGVGSLHLIAVGGLVARKGPVLAVQTLVELISRGVDADLTWVGDGELADEMRRTAERAGIGDRLRLTGQLPPDALSGELLAADLFLLPVETETFGVALAEALAHGLPVVASGTGGHEEFLPADASRLVSERTVPALADAVQSIVADPDRWERSRIADYALSRFSSAARAEAYGQVYARAISR